VDGRRARTRSLLAQQGLQRPVAARPAHRLRPTGARHVRGPTLGDRLDWRQRRGRRRRLEGVSERITKFVYDPALAGFELAPDHPFKPLRFELTRTLLSAAGLLAADDLVIPRAMDDDAILEVHDSRYVETVKTV